MTTDVLVIGGGASGLMAASTAAARGLRVAVLEKNKIFGKKIRITGKGRCNITNNCDNIELIRNIPNNGKFLYSSFSHFSSSDCIAFFENWGVPIKIERGKRAFPASDSAHDIADCLIKNAKNDGATLLSNYEVEGIVVKENFFSVNSKNGRRCSARAVILATGGLSYPLTGSTGDGFSFAEKFGHTIVPPKPALVPLEAAEKWVSRLEGLSLKNVGIRAAHFEEKNGELVFTGFGVSGPAVLTASCHISTFPTQMTIDLKPALTLDTLNDRLTRDFTKNINKDFSNALDALLPKRLIPIIIELSNIPPEKKVHQVTREERKNLAVLLKNLTLTITKTRPIEEAIITSGGVDVMEINPSTLESKLVPNLFFAGELIDISAYTGGFNLQIAFATGYLAGMNVLKDA